MFNYLISFIKIIKDNLPWYLRFPIRLKRIEAMIKPIRDYYNEFITKKNELFYKSRNNGSVISLETTLNDRFDPINRAIFISEYNYDHVYIYKKSELKPAIVLYFKYKPAQSYVVGEFAWMPSNLVYVCNTNCTGKVPGVDPEWTLTTRKAPIIRMAANFNGAIGFVVNVPVSLVFDLAEMNAHIKYWKLAGPGYIIITF